MPATDQNQNRYANDFTTNGPVRRERIFLWGAISLAALIKLWLSFNTYGTNDITSWKRFADHIYQHGFFDIYSAGIQYNHPPAVTTWLWLLRFATDRASDWFPFFFRLPAILSDIGSAYLVWRFALHYLPSRIRLMLALVFALNPVSIMVSGFHGNTDPIFTFLILISVFLLVFKSWPALAGGIFGLALNVKIVPLILLPAFYLWLRARNPRIHFVLGAGAVFIAGFALHFVFVPREIFHNVFGYGSFTGFWGISRIFVNSEWLFSISKAIILILAFGFSYYATSSVNNQSKPLREQTSRGEDLIRAIGGTYIIFLTLTPGFGVQYLVWFLPFSLFWGRFQITYTIFSSCFIFLSYTYWSGLPWDYANSWQPGGPRWAWNYSVVAGFLTWIWICALFLKEAGGILIKIRSHISYSR